MRKGIKINQIHIGEKIKEVLELRERTVTWFAEKMCCERTNVYAIFKRKSINTDQLETISKILDFDFFALYNPDAAHTEEYNAVLEQYNKYLQYYISETCEVLSENMDAIKAKNLTKMKDEIKTHLENSEFFADSLETLINSPEQDYDLLLTISKGFQDLRSLLEVTVKQTESYLKSIEQLSKINTDFNNDTDEDSDSDLDEDEISE